MSLQLDSSRKWVRGVGDEITAHHALRYRFAKTRINGSTLDAACGCGYGTEILASSGHDVLGIDCDPKAIVWAKSYFPNQHFICGHIEDRPWEERFSSVVSLETLEHLKNPAIALKAFRESADTLIASVPNEELYPFKPEVFSGDDYPHQRHYTPSEFEELLSSAGFVVVERFCQKDKNNPEVIEGTNGRFLIYVCA